MSASPRILTIVARRVLALPVLPGLLVLAWLAGIALPERWSDSWYNASAHMQSLVVVLAPMTAALAAWEGGRSRRSGFFVLAASAARSELAVGAVTVAVVTGYGVAAYVLGFIAAGTRVVGGGTPAYGLLTLGLLGLLVATALGYAAGLVIHPVFAAPAVAVASYVWLVFGSQAQPEWLARLSFLDDGCCSANVRLNPAVLIGQSLWLAGLLAAVGAIVALRSPTRPMLRKMPAALALAFMLSGLALLIADGGRLTRARSPVVMACQESARVRVCVWPEHRYQLMALGQAAETGLGPLVGVQGVPTEVVEIGLDRAAAPNASLVLGLPAEAVPPAALVPRVLQSLLPPPPPCATATRPFGYFPGADARPYLRAWLDLRANPNIPLTALLPPPYRPGLEKILTASTERQLAWFVAARASQGDCATPAPPLP